MCHRSGNSIQYGIECWPSWVLVKSFSGPACFACQLCVHSRTVCFDCHLCLLSAFSSLFLVLFPYLWKTCSQWQVVKPIPVWRPLSSQLRFPICHQLLFRLYLHWLSTWHQLSHSCHYKVVFSNMVMLQTSVKSLWPVASILAEIVMLMAQSMQVAI